MGNLARDVLFRMPARDVIHYSMSPALTNLMHGQVPATILKLLFTNPIEGAQWLSGRVLDSRPKGRGFEPHRRHCVVVLEQDTFILA